MKKLLLFFAALCCALGVSAQSGDVFYDELPSGKGRYERTIVNMDYNVKTKTLSFDDTYLPTFYANTRSYLVYFHEWKPEYKFVVQKWDDMRSEVYYQGNLIKQPGEDSDIPSWHFLSAKAVFNSNGGNVAIDISEAIKMLKTVTSSTDFLVSIRASYQVVAGVEDFVEYSIYPEDKHKYVPSEGCFLLNSKHINIEGNPVTVSPEIVRAVTAQGLVTPQNKKSVELRANGTDGAMLQADIQVKSDVEKDVTYIWEYRDDNSGDWKQLSKGTVSKDNFNTKPSIQKIPTCEVNFTASNKPQNVRYVRARLDTEDGGAVFYYKTEVALYLAEEKYDLFIGGKQITSKNCDDPLGQNTAARYAKYDATTNTLTLNDVSLECEASNASAIDYYGNKPLNIYIQGKSYIYNFTDHDAIYSESADVKIYGDGTLTIVNSDTPTGGITIDGNLTVSDGAKLWIRDLLMAKKEYYGISLYGDGVLTVDYATIEVKGTPAIWNVKDIVMKNGVNILSAGHKFDAAKKAVVDASGNATNETVIIGVGTPDAIQNVVAEKTSQNGKFVRNNQLIIKRNGVYYNANGVKVSAM